MYIIHCQVSLNSVLLIEYTVRLTPTTISKKRQAVEPIIMMFSSDASGGIVTGLTGSTTYSVTVTVSNGDTEGPTSPPTVIIPLPVDGMCYTVHVHTLLVEEQLL